MSHTVTVACGCVVHVACNPETKLAHTRVIEARAPTCHMRRHEVGLRLFLSEMLPGPDRLKTMRFVHR